MRKLGLFALSFTAAAAGYVYLRLGWTVLALAGAALVRWRCGCGGPTGPPFFFWGWPWASPGARHIRLSG